MNYYTSDLHIGHYNILSFCSRPFRDLQEMHERLVENWNKKVKSTDSVYVLGDVFWKPNYISEVSPFLNGTKYCVAGNHDLIFSGNKPDKVKQYTEIWEDNGWIILPPQYLLDEKYLLCHFPWAPEKVSNDNPIKYLQWRPKKSDFPGIKLLFGHTHCEKEFRFSYPDALNIGVDAWDYSPVSEVEVDKEFLSC